MEVPADNSNKKANSQGRKQKFSKRNLSNNL